MVDKYWEYIARKPRHRATDPAGLRAEVERSAGALPALVEAEVLNLSRDGIQLRLAVPLLAGESITVRLQHEKCEPSPTLSAAVRWRRPEEDQAWSAGCVFTRPVDWETLGELFLNELLAKDGSSPEAPQPASTQGPGGAG